MCRKEYFYLDNRTLDDKMHILWSVIRYYECFLSKKSLCLWNKHYIYPSKCGCMPCYQSVFCPLLTFRPLSLSEALPVFTLCILHERQELILYDSVRKSCRKGYHFICVFLAMKYLILHLWNLTVFSGEPVTLISNTDNKQPSAVGSTIYHGCSHSGSLSDPDWGESDFFPWPLRQIKNINGKYMHY